MEKVGGLPEGDRPLLLDLFDVDNLQKIQDSFSDATGLAAIMTLPDGTPVTTPSNFTSLCSLIRTNPKGRHLCQESDAAIGKGGNLGPQIVQCHSCGLWDAGAPVYVNKTHIGSWLIGQVRNEETDTASLVEYAASLGILESDAAAALDKVPFMGLDQFKKVANALYVITEQLSRLAFQNIQLRRLSHDHKNTIIQLEEEQGRSTAIIQAMPDLLAEIDSNGIILNFINGRTADIHFFRDTLVFNSISSLMPEDASTQVMEKLQQVFCENIVQKYAYVMELDDVEREYEIRLAKAGEKKALALFRDMTDFRTAVRDLERSSIEKDLLIKELFHRTKNSMQMIRSLLSLQAEVKDNPEIKTALKAAETRILSMAVVHQKLYESDNLASINLHDYIPDLAAQVFSLMDADSRKINLLCNVEKINVLIDIAIPIGLLITELITNALVHSFRGSRRGFVQIKVLQKADDKIMITVENNGESPDPDFIQNAPSSLGMLTVQALVHQLEGSFTWKTDCGLSYRIEVKNSGYENRLVQR